MALAVGHLVRVKGFDLLIQAWSEIPLATRDGWRVRLVGSGEEENALKALASRLGVADTVDFAGRRKEMADEYGNARFFVLSSRSEGFPMVLLEAMAFGLPIVAFNCGTGPAELVIDGKTGLLVPPEDIPALSQAMARVIGELSFRSECARHALQRSSDYTIARISEKWTGLIESLSAGLA